MTITEMISAIGDDNIKYQWLIECFIKANIKPRFADVLFRTERENAMSLTSNNPDVVGIILWVPKNIKDKIFQSMDNNKEESINV
jgi:hypothetical protein